MALGKGTISKITLKMGADIKSLTKDLSLAQKKISTFSQNVKRSLNDAAISSKRAFTGVTRNAAWQQGAVAATGMALALRSSVREAMTFEKSMDVVASKITGVTDAQMKALTDQAKLQGRITKFTASQVGGAQAFLAQAGLAPKAIKSMIPAILKLSEATDAPLEFVADKVSNIAGGFQLTEEQIPHLTDVLAQATRSGNVDLEQLSASFAATSGTAKMFGLSIEETANAFDIMGNNGLQGEKAGMQMRNILSRMTGSGKKHLDSLGVSIKDNQGNMRNLKDILSDFNEETKNMDAADRIALMGKVFGERNKEGAGFLLNSMESGDWTKNLAKVMDNKGAAKEMAKISQDNLAGAFTRFGSAISGLQVALIGNTKGLQGFVDAISGGINKLTDFIDKFPIMGKLIVGVSTAFIGLIALAPFIAAFVSLVGSLGTAFVAIKAGLAASAAVAAIAAAPMWAIVAAVAGIVAGLALIWKYRKPLGKFFSFIFKIAFKVIGGIAKAVFWLVKKCIQAFLGIFDFVLNVVMYLPRKFFSAGKAILQGLWNGLKWAWGELKTWFSGMAEWIDSMNPFKGWIEAIQTAIDKLKFWKGEVEDENDINPENKEFKQNLGTGMGDSLGIPKDGNFFKDEDPTLKIPSLDGASLGGKGGATTNHNNNSITINLPEGIYDADDIANKVTAGLENMYAMADTNSRAALHD